MEYLIRGTAVPPSLCGEWDSPVWSLAEIGELTHFLPASSDHHPRVQFRLLYGETHLYVIFRVEDRYVRSVFTEFNEQVCRDSCTELFIKPPGDKGYINFEVNCGGTLLAYHMIDPTKIDGKYAKYDFLTPEDGKMVSIFHSMPSVVDPEIEEPVVWVNEFHIPFALFEKYMGPLGSRAGQQWTANLYKCADHTSHPHWLSWSEVIGHNFHQPQYFAPLIFER